MAHKRSGNVAGPAGKHKRWLAMIGGSTCVLAVCLVVRYYWGAEPASADQSVGPPAGKTAAASAAPVSGSIVSPLPVVAVVNSRQITREILGRECLRHYGKEVLDKWINKLLIAQECARREIVVSSAEVDAEVKRMAKRFSLPVDQWLKLLKQERGIPPQQYAEDIIWPTLALRRLAGERLKVTRQEMLDAYDKQYGPRIRARLISCKDIEKAQRLHATAAAKPEEFGNLAKEHSEDASASSKGLIEPIRMHGSYKEIEQAAFSMKDGEISAVIHAGGQYVILKREREIPAAKWIDFEQVAPRLEALISDGKLRRAAGEIFQHLKKEARVVNYLEHPNQANRHSIADKAGGIAAMINGQTISEERLAERCIDRHGLEVLEGTINRTLIELACEKHKVVITEADVDREIVQAASTSVPLKDGKPDVEAWLKLATEDQGISLEVYRRDAVWPSVALKKLIGDQVRITNEDMQKGYDANYGPRVRCLAIVLNNFRRAQEVWDMARNNRTAEYFGELAEQYSIEPGSRALRGEVPPIKKHGGQPQLEREAFSLQESDLSGVIQVGEQFIILYCLGHTKPIEVTFEEVRAEIYEHIYEKKQRAAMAELFQHLKDTATIENLLAGTVHRPQQVTPKAIPAAGARALPERSTRR